MYAIFNTGILVDKIVNKKPVPVIPTYFSPYKDFKNR